jgi:hypothetical protein
MSLIFIEKSSKFLELIPNKLLKHSNYIIYNNNNLEDIIRLVNINTTEFVFIYDNNNTFNIPFLTQNIGNYFYFSDDLIKLFQYTKNLSGQLSIKLISNNLNNEYFLNEIKLIENQININIITDDNIMSILKEEYLPKSLLKNKPLTFTDLPSNYFKISNINDTRICTLLQNIDLNNITNWIDSNTYILLETNDIFDGNNHTITVSWMNEGIFESNADSSNNMPIVKNLIVNSIKGISDFGGGIIKRDQRFFIVDNCRTSGINNICAGGICGAYAGTNNGYCIIRNCESQGNKFKIRDIYNNEISLSNALNSIQILQLLQLDNITTENTDIIFTLQSEFINNEDFVSSIPNNFNSLFLSDVQLLGILDI